MKKVLSLPAFVVSFALCGFAQNWASVTAVNITDLNQQKLASGTLCFLGTDQNDVPIGFQAGAAARC